MDCNFCNGTGSHPTLGALRCPVCRGFGTLSDDLLNYEKCRQCKGSGHHPTLPGIKCDICGGIGRDKGRPRPEPPLKPKPKPKSRPKPKGPTVSYIQKGRVFSARQDLNTLLSTLTGTVRVCDPYCGEGSFVSLASFDACDEVHFLTTTPH